MCALFVYVPKLIKLSEENDFLLCGGLHRTLNAPQTRKEHRIVAGDNKYPYILLTK
jgi:hypothetical protein